MHSIKSLRLVLGDQLNRHHSWFKETDDTVLYCMMEVRSESEYVKHHIQKIVGIFGAMRDFANALKKQGHRIHYLKISDRNNKQSFVANLLEIKEQYGIQDFAYQEPDEYRLDMVLKSAANELGIPSKIHSTQHFLTQRDELKVFFEGKKTYLMESFYRSQRKKHKILMDAAKPVGGKWNYDVENRKKLKDLSIIPEHKIPKNNVMPIYDEVINANLPFIGRIDANNFIWPINPIQAEDIFDTFLQTQLPFFGTYQDTMVQSNWMLFHSRISFALNTKMLNPFHIIQRAEKHWKENQEKIGIAQVEGFIRQILGWREYMRGVYWAQMPSYASKNYFYHTRTLPKYFWSGDTKMNCIGTVVNQSLENAYAHHIQRLMVTGNFLLMAGVNPSYVDEWYLGIYIDAFEWVEITNTRGMSQFADGGIVATKPYISTASYINKMGDYCANCQYDKNEKTGPKACPFNSLYWNFLDQNKEKLQNNPRMAMMYRVWGKFSVHDQQNILSQAEYYLDHLEEL